MTKAKRIVEFIKKNKPRRKELVRFILVDLNKRLTAREYDELESTDSLHAYYSTNICKWRQNGNVEVDEKRRYRMTKYYNGKLYSVSTKVQIEMLEERAKHWKNAFLKERAENELLRNKLEEIADVLS